MRSLEGGESHCFSMLIFLQTWSSPHSAPDDDQPEQQRHDHDPSFEQDLSSHRLDPDQHGIYPLRALRVLLHPGAP